MYTANKENNGKKVIENDLELEFVSGIIDEDETALDLKEFDSEEEFDNFTKLENNTTALDEPKETEAKKHEYEVKEAVKEEDSKKKEMCIINKFSSRAFKDGYRFSELTDEEQRMTRYLYVSEDVLSSFYLATKRVEEMNAFPDEKFHFKYGFGMPFNGYYLGHIIGCKRSEKKLNSYILKILVSEDDVRCFNFTPGILSPISQAMSNDLGKRMNVFSREGYDELCGCVVRFCVQNTEMQTGKEYSNITDFDFLNNKEYSVIKKMINIMLNQS